MAALFFFPPRYSASARGIYLGRKIERGIYCMGTSGGLIGRSHILRANPIGHSLTLYMCVSVTFLYCI